MKSLLKLLIISLPISFLFMFFILLNEDKQFPGADYREFDLPIFNLEDLDDTRVINNTDIQGASIINIWASWCITCQIEHPYLMNLNKKGIPVIGINYKDNKIDALEWIKNYGNPYSNIGVDFDGRIAIEWGVYGIPESFIISKKNIIKYKIVGPITKENYDDLLKNIKNP